LPLLLLKSPAAYIFPLVSTASAPIAIGALKVEVFWRRLLHSKSPIPLRNIIIAIAIGKKPPYI
jgi:hypothetical protein